MVRKKQDRTIDDGAEDPSRLYLLIHLASFTKDWTDLGLGDDELRALEDEIADAPTRVPVVSGGGGVRKLRRPDPLSGKGKSGGYRVLYAFLPVHGTVVLIAAWPKSEREDLERDDYKAISKAVARIQVELDQRRKM